MILLKKCIWQVVRKITWPQACQDSWSHHEGTCQKRLCRVAQRKAASPTISDKMIGEILEKLKDKQQNVPKLRSLIWNYVGFHYWQTTYLALFIKRSKFIIFLQYCQKSFIHIKYFLLCNLSAKLHIPK